MQPSIQHQMMGYDRAITMFSPEGRLLQVEYAKKTVKQGSTTIGMICKDGVILIADKRIIDPLIVPEAVEKIWKIDDHIGASASGILSDARVLIEMAQLKAQQHKVTYDNPIDIITIVKEIADIKQVCTQSGGLRPFGVSILVAGVDEEGPKLFETDPTGIYFRYYASVIGEGEEQIEEELHKKYNKNITTDEGLKLLFKLLKKFLKQEFSTQRLDVAVIKTKDKKYKKLTKEEIDKLVKKL